MQTPFLRSNANYALKLEIATVNVKNKITNGFSLRTLFMKCWQMTWAAITPSPSIKTRMTLLEDAVRNKLRWI